MSKQGFEVEAFWKLVERVGAASGGDLDRACKLFRAELDTLDDASVVQAEGLFDDTMRRAHD
jgi:hypothetical protein